MLSIDEVIDQEWADYEAACRRQAEAFERHAANGFRGSFAGKDVAREPMIVLRRILSPAVSSQEKLTAAAEWLWLHPMSSAKSVMQETGIGYGDFNRLVVQCAARMDSRADGDVGYCLSDEFSVTNKIGEFLRDRIECCLGNAGESSLEQIIAWTFSRRGEAVKSMKVMTSIGQVNSRQGPQGLLYSLRPGYDKNAPTHKLLTEEEKQQRQDAKRGIRPRKKMRRSGRHAGKKN